MFPLLLFSPNFSIAILVHKIYLHKINKKWDAPGLGIVGLGMIEGLGMIADCLTQVAQKQAEREKGSKIM